MTAIAFAPGPLPRPPVAWIDPETGQPTPIFFQFMLALMTPSSLPNFANDAAAAAGGVGVNQFYRNGSVVQVRVT
jgi:hypothetical protein